MRVFGGGRTWMNADLSLERAGRAGRCRPLDGTGPRNWLVSQPRPFYGGRVHLARIKLRDYRNYTRLDAQFAPGLHVILGDNAQGKTNLLEAIYLMATLRSFRGVGSAHLVRHGAKGYFVGGEVVGTGSQDIKIFWSPRERKLSLNGQPVKRLADYYGVLRTVVFCSEDLQLVKGSSRFRRRFLDLLLAQTQPGYLALLQRYLRALRARNALLKQPAPDELALDSFTGELAAAGNEIMRHRREMAPRILPLVRQACRSIANDLEEPRLLYKPGAADDLAAELRRLRPRERVYRVTLAGPHRDEVELLLNDRSAAQFGSEGQKRSLAIALKMAQAEYLATAHGTPPILLIDDVMGELDLKRRSALLPLLEQAHLARGQVFMTCTEENWPAELSRTARRWVVETGLLRPAS